MKLYPTFNKLPFIALLSLGLVCSPLVVSAADNDHDRHDHYPQDRGKSHHRVDHRRDYRDHQNDRRHDKRSGYGKHKKSHPVKSPDIYHGNNYGVQPYLIWHHRNVVVMRPYGQWCL
jgi:hypothetical protein